MSRFYHRFDSDAIYLTSLHHFFVPLCPRTTTNILDVYAIAMVTTENPFDQRDFQRECVQPEKLKVCVCECLFMFVCECLFVCVCVCERERVCV